MVWARALRFGLSNRMVAGRGGSRRSWALRRLRSSTAISESIPSDGEAGGGIGRFGQSEHGLQQPAEPGDQVGFCAVRAGRGRGAGRSGRPARGRSGLRPARSAASSSFSSGSADCDRGQSAASTA